MPDRRLGHRCAAAACDAARGVRTGKRDTAVQGVPRARRPCRQPQNIGKHAKSPGEHGGTAHGAGTGRRAGRDRAGERGTQGRVPPAPPGPIRTLTAPRPAGRLRCSAGGAGAAGLLQCLRRLAAARERGGPRPRHPRPPGDRRHAAAGAIPAGTTTAREDVNVPAPQAAPTGSAAGGPPQPRARARAIGAYQKISGRAGSPGTGASTGASRSASLRCFPTGAGASCAAHCRLPRTRA